jgi:cytochrome c553
MKSLAWVACMALALGSGAATAAGNAAAGKIKAAACGACHGADGNSTNPLWPKLAGQPPEYLVKQLADFKSGARKDPLMSPQAAALGKADMQDIAAYYAGLRITPGAAAADAEMLKRGERLYRGGNAKFGVAACMSCHGPSGHGIPPRFPRVSGQHAAYNQKQLLAYKSGARHNDNEVMTRIAFRLSEAEIKALAQYMAGLH